MERLRRYWDSSNEPASCHAPWVVRAGALGTALVCCLQSLYLLGLMNLTEDYRNLITVIDVDWEITRGVRFLGLGGVRLFAALSYAATLLAVAFAAVGCIVSKWQVATPICIYFCGTAMLALFFFGMFGHAVTFSTTLEPVIERQGQEFCNATLHWTYSAALHCSMASKKALLPAGWVLDTCGDDCKDRLELLKRMGGCALLQSLCHQYDYQSMGFGACVIREGNETVPPPRIRSVDGQKVPENCCKLACDTRVQCQGYNYNAANGTCMVFSPRKPKAWVLDEGDGKLEGDRRQHPCAGLDWAPNTTSWPDKVPVEIVGADGHLDTVCYRKSKPELVSAAESAAFRAGILFLVTAVTLASTSVCGCALQYTVVTRRKGKKGAGALVSKMMCSCCSGRSERLRKFGHALSTGSTSDEDSEFDDLASDS